MAHLDGQKCFIGLFQKFQIEEIFMKLVFAAQQQMPSWP